MSKTHPRVWFITGASSGFGRCLTEHVLSRGEIAVATLRSPPALDDLRTKYSSDQLLILKCDVSIPGDIASAFSQTKQKYSRCDVVFNNAGYGILGEVEGTPEDTARRMFDVNFWGAANVNREAVQFFRENNPNGVGGLLLVNSSVSGISAWPGVGYYAASKHALEGVTEALAKELDAAWNIRICIVEPAGFATKGITHGIINTPVHPAYTNESMVTQMVRKMLGEGKMNGDPDKAADRFIEFADASLKPECPGLGDVDLKSPLPFRWALGEEALEQIRPKVKSLEEDMEKSVNWSKGLMLSDP